jgi:ribosomal protein S26
LSKGKGLRTTYWKRDDVRSGLEARVREDLDERGIKYEYETVKLPYIKKYCPACGEAIQKGNYIPDFIIGSIIVEVKGRFTAQDRKKHISVRELNPDVDIRILFQRDQKIGKNSTTKYSTWCDKKGIVYAFGETVPEEWIQDSTK